MLPLLQPAIIVKPIPKGYDNPSWPLIEMTAKGPVIIRGENWKQKRNRRIREESLSTATVTNVAQNSATVSVKEATNEWATTKPPWED
jgi:hypothetical protein